MKGPPQDPDGRGTLQRRVRLLLSVLAISAALLLGTLMALTMDRVRADVEAHQRQLAVSISQTVDRTLSGAALEIERLSQELARNSEPASALRDARTHSSLWTVLALESAHPGEAPLVEPHTGSIAPGGPTRGFEANCPEGVARGMTWAAYRRPLSPGRGTSGAVLGGLSIGGNELDALIFELAAGTSLQLAIVDAGGTVIAASTADNLLERLPVDQLGVEPSAGVVLIRENETCSLCGVGDRTVPAITAWAALHSAPWWVVVAEPRESVLGAYVWLRRATLASAGILLLLTLGLMHALTRSIVRPLEQLSARAARLVGGDLSSPFRPEGDAEIAALATALEAARDRLATAVDTLERRVDERTRELALRDEERGRLLRRLLDATEDERRRVARELHDETAQLLTAIQLSLETLDANDPEIARAQQLARDSQAEIHRLIHNLRPSLLDDLGLGAAITSHLRRNVPESGPVVQLEIQPDLKPAPAVDTAIFRIFQEALTNVLRHARAERVGVELYDDGDRRILDVEDDGAGFDPSTLQPGSGLVGMRERAELVGGTIHWDSEPQTGTHLRLEVPRTT